MQVCQSTWLCLGTSSVESAARSGTHISVYIMVVDADPARTMLSDYQAPTPCLSDFAFCVSLTWKARSCQTTNGSQACQAQLLSRGGLQLRQTKDLRGRQSRLARYRVRQENRE